MASVSSTAAWIHQRTTHPKKFKIFSKHKNKEMVRKMKERSWKWQVIKGSICYKVLNSLSIYKVLLLRSQRYHMENASSSKTDVCAFYGNCQCDRFKNSKFRNFVVKKFSFLNFKNVKMCCLKKPKDVCKSSKPTLSQKNLRKKRFKCSVNSYLKPSDSSDCEVSLPETSLVNLTNIVTFHDIANTVAIHDAGTEYDALVNSELSTNRMSDEKVCPPEELTCPGTSLVVNDNSSDVVAFRDTDMKLIAPINRKIFIDWQLAEDTCSVLEVSSPKTSTNVNNDLTDSLMLRGPMENVLSENGSLFTDWNLVEEICSSDWYSFISRGNINEKTLRLARVLTSSANHLKSSTIKRKAYSDTETVWDSLADSCASTWHTFIGQKDVFPKEMYSFIDSRKHFKNPNYNTEHIFSYVGRNNSANIQPTKNRALKFLEGVSPNRMEKDVLVHDCSNEHSKIDESPEDSKPSSKYAEYDLNTTVAYFNSNHVHDPCLVYPGGSLDVKVGRTLEHGFDGSLKSLSDNCISLTNSFTEEDMDVDEKDLITNIVLYSAAGNCTSHITSEKRFQVDIEETIPHSSSIHQCLSSTVPELSGQSFGSVISDVSKCPVSFIENGVLHTSFGETVANEHHPQPNKVMNLQQYGITSDNETIVSKRFEGNLKHPFLNCTPKTKDVYNEAKLKDSTSKVLSSNHVSSSCCSTSADDSNEISEFRENKLPNPFPSCKVVMASSCWNVRTQPETNDSEGHAKRIVQKLDDNIICELTKNKNADSEHQRRVKQVPSKGMKTEIKVKFKTGQNTINKTEKKLCTHSKPNVVHSERSVFIKSQPDTHVIYKTQNNCSEIVRTKGEFKNAHIKANTIKKSKISTQQSAHTENKIDVKENTTKKAKAHIENKTAKSVPNKLADSRLDPSNLNGKIPKSDVIKLRNPHFKSSVIDGKAAKPLAVKLCDPRLDSEGELKYGTHFPRPMQLKRVKWGFKKKRPKEKPTITVDIPMLKEILTTVHTATLNNSRPKEKPTTVHTAAVDIPRPKEIPTTVHSATVDIPRPKEIPTTVHTAIEDIPRPKEIPTTVHTATLDIPISTSHQPNAATNEFNPTYLSDPRLKRRFSADTVHDLKNRRNFIAEENNASVPTIDLRVLKYTAPLIQRHSVESSINEQCEFASEEMTDKSPKSKHMFQRSNSHIEPQKKKSKYINWKATTFEKDLYSPLNKKLKHHHIRHCPEDEVPMLYMADSKNNYEKAMFDLDQNEALNSFDKYRPQKYRRSFDNRKYSKYKCARKIHINIQSHKESERCWLHHKKWREIDRLDKKRACCDNLPRRVSHHEDLLMDNIVSSTTDATELPSKNLEYDDYHSSKMPSPDKNESVSSKPSFPMYKRIFIENISNSGQGSEYGKQKGYSPQPRQGRCVLPVPTLSKLEKMPKHNVQSANSEIFSNNYFPKRNFHSKNVSKITNGSDSTMASVSTTEKTKSQDPSSLVRLRKEFVNKYINRKAGALASISTTEKTKTKDPCSLVQLKKEFVSKYINRKAGASETASKISKNPVLSMPSLAAIEGKATNPQNPVKNEEIRNKCVDPKNDSSKCSTGKRKSFTEALESNDKSLLLRSKAAAKKPKIFNPTSISSTSKLTKTKASACSVGKPEVVNHSTKTLSKSDISKLEKSRDITVKSRKNCENKTLKLKLRSAIKGKIALNVIENKKTLRAAKNKKSLNVIHNPDKINRTKVFTWKKPKTVIPDLSEKTNTKVMMKKKSKDAVQKKCNFKTTEKNKSESKISNSAKSNEIEVLTDKIHEKVTKSSIKEVLKNEKSENAVQNSLVTSKEKVSGATNLLFDCVTECNGNYDHVKSTAKSETLCDNMNSILGESKTEEGKDIESVTESDNFSVYLNNSDPEINNESKEDAEFEDKSDKLHSPDLTNKTINCVQNLPSDANKLSNSKLESFNIEQNVIDRSSNTPELKQMKVEVKQSSKQSDIKSFNAEGSVGAPEHNVEDQNLVQYSKEKLPSGEISSLVHTSDCNLPKQSSGINDILPLDNRNDDVENFPATELLNLSSLHENFDLDYWNYLSSGLFNSLLDSSVGKAKESVSEEHHASEKTEVDPPPAVVDPFKSCISISRQNISSYSSTNCDSFQAVLPQITSVVSIKNDRSPFVPSNAKHSLNYSVPRDAEQAQMTLQNSTQILPTRRNKKLRHRSSSSHMLSSKSNEVHDFEPRPFICSRNHSDGSKCNLNKSFKANCCYSDRPFPCKVTLSYSCIKANSANLFEENSIFDLYYRHLKQSGTHEVYFNQMKTKDQLDAYSQQAFDFLYGQLSYHECLLRSYIHKASEPGTPCDMNLIQKISVELDVIQGYRLACKAILL